MKKYINKFITLIFIILSFFFIVNQLEKFIPNKKEFFYSQESYIKTIDSSISGIVVEILHFRVPGVKLSNGQRFNLIYTIDKLPNNWRETYPNEFVEVGDSLIKNAHSTEFTIVRNEKRYKYYLPKDDKK